MGKRVGVIAVLLIALILCSCAGLAEREMAESYDSTMRAEAYADSRSASGSAPPSPAPKAAASRPIAPASSPSAANPAMDPSLPAEQPAERKRVFSGFCRLLVDDVEDTRTEIADIADRSGGYVENVSGNTVVIRVPAERFDEIFNLVLSFGEVSHKSVETYDVTEFFQDLEIRLEIATKTRERLYALLEKTTDVEERLQLLREIKRLTEEIEGIENSLELLQRRIDFSRITVELTPRLPETGYDKGGIPFSWIAHLNPLYPSFGSLEVRFELELNEDFAVFIEEEAFRAESAGGTRVRLGTTANHPTGDTGFWQKALAYHLGPFYRSTEKIDLGVFKGVLFASKDPEPFSYFVAVSAEKDGEILPDLLVLEIFFPDRHALQERFPPLKESIRQIRLK